MPAPATYTDRRQSQTADRYAADDLETMQLARRYASHVFDLFRPHLGSRVLEVGCGIGTMTERLLDVADLVVGIEPNQNCAVLTRAAVGAHPRFSMYACHLEECDRGELAEHRFDTVFCVNVLEHIEDDVAALRLFREVLVPGGGCSSSCPPCRRRTGRSTPNWGTSGGMRSRASGRPSPPRGSRSKRCVIRTRSGSWGGW
jgi:2-polyprenyl-3-methyl-5-hydroxy-6-metoxy-1,4-benzoquinol methylase